MKPLEEQMAFYAAYHRDGRNKATHYVGVPMIMLSLFVPLAWIRVDVGGMTVSAAMVLAAAVLVYYFLLDKTLGLAMLAVSALLVWLGHRIAAHGSAAGWTWFALLFIGGWILQLVGHAFEGRRPALVDNLFQIFVAPVFLAADGLFALGWNRALRARVAQLSREHSARGSTSPTRSSTASGASRSRPT